MTGGEVAGTTGAGGAVTPRVLVVWCPDWPVAAVERPAEDGGPDVPVAVVEGGRVLACSAAARAAGVRQGQRLKLAQRLCPALELRDRDPEAEARRFEPVVAAVEAFTPRVEVLRPGLCAIPVKGPARYFGGEEALAAKVQGAVTAALAASAAAVAARTHPSDAHPSDAHPSDVEPAGSRAAAERGDAEQAEVVPLRPAGAGRAGERRTAGVDE
ncbi:hypothetical protein ACFXAM_38430, partial [Kitasatospora sp. NPDC059462]